MISYDVRLLVLTWIQTIAGGSGAGPGWHGTSGVHTHITNTRIGDVEILERRYPVIVHQFGLRQNSAGQGKWNGGEGVVRHQDDLRRLLAQHETGDVEIVDRDVLILDIREGSTHG